MRYTLTKTSPYPLFERAPTLVGRFVTNIDFCLGKVTWAAIATLSGHHDQ